MACLSCNMSKMLPTMLGIQITYLGKLIPSPYPRQESMWEDSGIFRVGKGSGSQAERRGWDHACDPVWALPGSVVPE